MTEDQGVPTRTVAQRLMLLAQLYEQGQPSEVVDRTVDKLIAYEIDMSRDQLTTLRADLAEFEKQYGMSSSEFYHHFQAGQTDDRMDFIEWASLVQMAWNLEERLRYLANETSS